MNFHLLSRMLFHNHRRVFVNTEHISNQNKTRPESKQLLFSAAICSGWELPVLLVTAEEGSHLLTTGVSVQNSCNNVYWMHSHRALSRHCLLTGSRDLCLVNAEGGGSDVCILDIDWPVYLPEQMCLNSVYRVKYYWPLRMGRETTDGKDGENLWSLILSCVTRDHSSRSDYSVITHSPSFCSRPVWLSSSRGIQRRYSAQCCFWPHAESQWV